MTIGEKIRKLRRDHGLSQLALALEIGTSQKTVAAWELGKFKPGMDSIRKLCQGFNINVNDLMKGVD